MTEYLCHECGIKTKLVKWLDEAEGPGIPTSDECPNCGEKEKFEYL